jgi:hypothetical protein
VRGVAEVHDAVQVLVATGAVSGEASASRIVFVATVALAVMSCSVSVPGRDPGDDARRAAVVVPRFPPCAPMAAHAEVDEAEATVVGELGRTQEMRMTSGCWDPAQHAPRSR